MKDFLFYSVAIILNLAVSIKLYHNPGVSTTDLIIIILVMFLSAMGCYILQKIETLQEDLTMLINGETVRAQRELKQYALELGIDIRSKDLRQLIEAIKAVEDSH